MTIIGTLALRDWDAGVPFTMHAEVAKVAVDGALRNVNVVRVPGVKSGIAGLDDCVPILYMEPEDGYQEFVLPCYMFKLTSMTPGWDRHPWYQWVARAPAKGAQKIVLPDGRVGYDRYENQWRAEQYDLSYDVEVKARRRQTAILMLQYALSVFKSPAFVFRVIDSLGDTREYDAVDVSSSETSELADIADRTISWTVSFTVRGEIDLEPTVEMPAVQTVEARVVSIEDRPGGEGGA
jgi:hypothetical protein